MGKQQISPVTSPQDEFNVKPRLSSPTRAKLGAFVNDFLDSSFNPLFVATRRTIEREADRALKYHSRQYFYLISWFLRAERSRRKRRCIVQVHAPMGLESSDDTFALIASVLNQETFVLLNRSMQIALDNKDWHDLNACMTCFTQIVSSEKCLLPHRADIFVALYRSGDVRLSTRGRSGDS